MKREQKWYYLDSSSVVQEPVELYTWEDAYSLLASHRAQDPHCDLVIHEFERIDQGVLV